MTVSNLPEGSDPFVDETLNAFIEQVNSSGGIPRRIVDDLIAVIDGDQRVRSWDSDYLELLLDATEGLTVAHIRQAAVDGFGTGLPIVDS